MSYPTGERPKTLENNTTVTIKEALQLKGKPVIVPHCSRYQLPQLFVDLGYKVGAEIGVLRGGFTQRLGQAGLKVYGIDPWRTFHGQGRGQRIQANHDKSYEIAKELTAPYDVTLIRKTSMDAVGDFADGSLDFVYIDGDHNFRYVAEDIYEWSKKVRSGGMVSGDDYWHTTPNARNTLVHVDAVVEAYTKVFEIDTWWVIGKAGQVNDGGRNSWLFFKP